MTEALLAAIAVVAALTLIATVAVAIRLGRTAALSPTVETRLLAFEAAIARAELAIRDEAGRGREESGAAAVSLRQEVATSVAGLADALRHALHDLGQGQQTRLDASATQIKVLTEGNERRQEALRLSVETRLDAIRSENAAKLEAMRATVEEKLQSTLEQRLGASFKQVNDSLEQVYRSVGEMQNLAAGVGDLKRVLTNVKLRGIWGEVALGNLLEQVMAPDQYERNVEIAPGSQQRVEFAIRLPGDGARPVWLPLDAKFPAEDYERLIEAADRGDGDAVEAASKALETRIRNAARDICNRYVQPPHSTDFAVMFVPTEGLFAEILRRPGLIDLLQRECHVMVAGPTTLLSLLTALRMGFRSLAIQQRSAEVWQVLGAVKNEFGKFGVVLDGVSKKLEDTQKYLDEKVGPRRRAMDRSLRAVEILPEIEAAAMLGLDRLPAFVDDMADAPRDAAE